MTAGALRLVEIRSWMGRIWKVVFVNTWNGLRAKCGTAAPPLNVDRDGPVGPLATSLEQQRVQALATIADQTSGLLDGARGPACLSVTAKLEGDRRASLRAIETRYPALSAIADSVGEGEQTKVVCRVSRRERFESSIHPPAYRAAGSARLPPLARWAKWMTFGMTLKE